MAFASWFQWLKGHLGSSPLSHRNAARRTVTPRRSFLPRFDVLEDRTVPSTLNVHNNFDSGSGSLRATIAAANPGDTIVFDNTLIGKTITLTSGELLISKNLTINGLGANNLTVSGNDASRVFHVASGATVTISALTIAGGNATAGGGIDNAGILTLSSSTVAGNQSVGGLGGGGIYNEVGATLTVTGTTLHSNEAVAGTGLDVFGGGLLNAGQATVGTSTFSNNQALGGATTDFVGGSAGGAISDFNGATILIANSSFLANQAVAAAGTTTSFYFGLGGGLDVDGGLNGTNPSTATVNGCTFLSNVATGGTGALANGGALSSQGFGVITHLTNCTFSGNHAIGGVNGAGTASAEGGALGGAIINGGPSTLTATNCILTGNSAIGGSGAVPTAGNPNTGGGAGGGIWNGFLATLNLVNCTLQGNLAQGGNTTVGSRTNAVGGGIEITQSANLTMTQSRVVGNLALAGTGGSVLSTLPTGLAIGGGIDIEYGNVDGSTPSTAIISYSTISNNDAIGGHGGTGSAGGGAFGAGIAVGINAYLGQATGNLTFPDDSQLTLTHCIVNGNLALGGAGGSGANGGNAEGGGIWLYARPDTTASVTLTQTQVEQNFVIGGIGGSGSKNGQGLGGGVYNFHGTFEPDTFSLIIQNNASTGGNNIFQAP